ncbi:MAG: hypothetical protein C0604_05020, partial [Clostridiales bacterium]
NESKGVSMEFFSKGSPKAESPQKALDKPIVGIKRIASEHFSELERKEPNREEFKEILKAASEVIFGDDTHYEFKLHEKTGTMMCKLVDSETKETIREIPSEKILDMVAGIWELVGIIVDEKA